MLCMCGFTGGLYESDRALSRVSVCLRDQGRNIMITKSKLYMHPHN